MPPVQHLPRMSVSRTWRDVTPRNQSQAQIRKQYPCSLEVISILKFVWLLRPRRGRQAPPQPQPSLVLALLPGVTSAAAFLTSLPENSHGGLRGQEGHRMISVVA